MSTGTKWRFAAQALAAGMVCGTVFDLAGCANSLVTNFNPCGTVLNCDAAEWDALFIDTTDYNYNPTCTIATLWNCEDVITGGTTGTTTGTDNTFSGTGTTTTTGSGRTSTSGLTSGSTR